MEMSQVDTNGGPTEIALTGRADSAGVSKIETKFYAIVFHSERPVLVDLSGVSFIASLGLRMLITAAKALNRKGTKFVLHSAQDFVTRTIQDAGLAEMIPLVTARSAALEAAKG